MQRTGWLWIVLAGLYGAVSVALGAYAAHGMADADAYHVALMEKATRYQMIHAVVLAVVGGLLLLCQSRQWPALWFSVSGGLFAVGCLVFCGALYAIALAGLPAAALAPYGGMSLIAGWLALMVGGIAIRRQLMML